MRSEIATVELGPTRLWLLRTTQIGVAIGGLGIFAKLRPSLWSLASGFLTYAALQFAVQATARASFLRKPSRALFIIADSGIAIAILGLLGLAWAITLRTNFSNSSSAVGTVLIVTVLVVSSVLVLRGRLAQLSHEPVSWFWFTLGGIGAPVLLAWLIGSVVAAVSMPVLTPADAHLRQKQLTSRLSWARLDGWRKPDGQPMTIVVALSGGGYRAATVHAGFLQALDERCVPIRYLTTVSGGSIIGAYYALGNSPNQFKEVLLRRRPGLPDEYLSIWSVFAEWFWPWWTSADTYSSHFKKAFFGSTTLADTAIAPQLIIVATDIEQGLDGREALFKGRNRQFPELDATLLADAVAASAAFPGAFQPKTIYWPPTESNAAPGRRRFVDGGVIDNLGYAGFTRFLFTTAWMRGVPVTMDESGVPVDKDIWTPTLPRPDLFIVSDASAATRAMNFPNKVGVLDLVERAEDIAYSIQLSLIRGIIEQASLRQPEPIRIPYNLIVRSDDRSVRQALQKTNFTFDNGQTISGSAVADNVAGIPTLRELNKQEVKQAFWLGHALGEIYWQKIDLVRAHLTGGSGRSCQ